MFQNLSDRLVLVLNKLKRRGALSAEDVTSALHEVRSALLEADVALPVVKHFIHQVKKRAVGNRVLDSVTPAQMVIKVVHDQLINALGSETIDLSLATTPPAVILLAGLQGSGKTTTSGKLARLLTQKRNKKVLLASLDVYRPAAQEQLRVLGDKIDVPVLPIVDGEQPVDIAKRALKLGRLEGFDVVILDTAGRLHLDDSLMEEVKDIQKIAQPIETLLIADAMTGQDAVAMATAFGSVLSLTGIVLTRIDGDARGGAALSMRHITGCPIKFVGVGENIDQFEIFHPARMADRILGMGDIVSLVEKATEHVAEAEAIKIAQKLESGTIDLTDMEAQLTQMQKMGGLSALVKMMPGANKVNDKMRRGMGFNDGALKKKLAIIRSMTPRERKYPKLLNASRRKRIAAGSGVGIPEINRLLKEFEQMSKMMKRMKKMGKRGTLSKGLSGFLPKV